MENTDSETFKKKALKGNSVVDFWAPWCGPCKVMGPHFEAAAEENSGTKFFKVNVDEEGELAQEYGVRSIPTMVLFKDGEEVVRTVGAMTKDKIEEKLKEAFE